MFGAILGPTVFSPLFAGKHLTADNLTVPWLAAAGISIGSALIVALVRPDTKKIAELITPPDASDVQLPRASLGEILRRPGMIQAMLTAFASFGVMVSVMNLTGYAVVEKHHHTQQDVFPIIGAHVLGMYALVLFVGFADRPRRPDAGARVGPARDGRLGPRASSGRRAWRRRPCSSSGSASAGTSRTSRRPHRWRI